MRRLVPLIALSAAALLAAPVPAADDADEAVPGSTRVVDWFPDAEFYPQYTADPLRPQSALKVLWVTDSEIPETGSSRFGLHLGGRFGLVRWHPAGRPDRGWQLDFEGGFLGHFDLGHELDNIGWDGLLGLYLSFLPSPDLGFRVGVKHDSAHIGDEYAERTGRTRIDATREELVAGVSWGWSDRWRLYAEGGLSYGLEAFQERGRLQLGGEYRGARRFWRDRMAWYAAVDLQSFQEHDWEVRSAAQIGFVLPTGRGTSRYRFALEVVHGRSILGEFAIHSETTVGVGWYLDF